MNTSSIKTATSILVLSCLISGCTVAQLEARLEANPQCKDVLNPKTGALMPCPGSDKAFYRDAGLATAKTNTSTSNAVMSGAASSLQIPVVSSTVTSNTKPISVSSDCKPQIHKKTGGTIPCPATD